MARYSDLIADAEVALAGGKYKECLRLAAEAIKATNDKEEKAEGYYTRGKAYMGEEDPAEAVKEFSKAIELEPQNGNGFYLLGYAQALSNDSVNALQSFVKALERGCDDLVKGQIYNLMSMINLDEGKYEDALKNLEQAEELNGIDFDILQRKAFCYSQMDDYRTSMYYLNQMKLYHPTEYISYSLAFHIFMELGMYDDALEELKKAVKYTDTDIKFYLDEVAYILLHDPDNDDEDSIRNKNKEALIVIQEGLDCGEPQADEAVNCYIQAADLQIALGFPEEAVLCLDAADDPVTHFNEGFRVYDPEILDFCGERTLVMEQESELPDLDPNDPMYGALSPIDDIPQKTDSGYILESDYQHKPEDQSRILAFYLTCAEMMDDYDRMSELAIEMQGIDDNASRYTGMYYELLAAKKSGDEKWETKYRDRINYWTKQALKDPADHVSTIYRIKAYMDLGDLEKAKELCSLLPEEASGPIYDEIERME